MLNTKYIIEKLMLENNWSVTDVCIILKSIKVSRPTIYNWISGDSQMTVEQLNILLEAASKNNSKYKFMIEENPQVNEAENEYRNKYYKLLEESYKMQKELAERTVLKPSDKPK